VQNKQLVHIGTFGQPLGLKGEIKIIMHTSDFKSFKSFCPYLNEAGKKIWFFDYLGIKNNKIVGKLKNCSDRNCAEELSGNKIFTNKKNLPKIEKNQFYVSDLIDCKVQTKNNKFLGTIINIDNFGAGDLINIKKSNGKTFYIPMNEENVIDINIKKRIIIVSPIKGIVD